MGAFSLYSLQLPAPDFQIPNARARALRVSDLMARAEQTSQATALVHIDTVAGGVTWIQPKIVAPEQRASTPEAAAASFLARYAPSVLGIDSAVGALRFYRVHEDGLVRHYRYAQYHQGYRVLHGQWIIHVIRTPTGYIVQGANGRVFPDIQIAESPVITRASAQSAALNGLRARSISQRLDQRVALSLTIQ
jgi:hypothetical protein